MRFRLALALSVSILIIGAASWSRLAGVEKAQPSIVALEADDKNYQDFLQNLLESKTASSTSAEEPLSNTDLIGRQLIIDYIGLATSGEAGRAGINALANTYVESIPALLKVEKIDYQDIKTTSDTKTGFENYSDGLAKIYARHADRINTAYAGKVGVFSSNGSDFSFAQDAAAAYENTALELKGLAVPLRLVPAHLRLINTHFSNAAAMRSIYNLEKDPVTASSGLLAIKENIDEESRALKEISEIMETNAI